MATDKKHIAVYLDPAVEVALVAFCEQKGLKSKKGTMFSAGVNAALAQFFGIVHIDSSNIHPVVPDNILATAPSNIRAVIPDNIRPVVPDNILATAPSNIFPKSTVVEVLPGKQKA